MCVYGRYAPDSRFMGKQDQLNKDTSCMTLPEVKPFVMFCASGVLEFGWWGPVSFSLAMSFYLILLYSNNNKLSVLIFSLINLISKTMIFPHIIQWVASKQTHMMEKHVLIGYQTPHVCMPNLRICRNVKPCFARVIMEVFWW